jgi:LuxR family maltose regulon positive regulatory protein
MIGGSSFTAALLPADVAVSADHADTRFRLSAARPEIVARTGRLPKLAAIDADIVLLTAPAGYGKTALVAEWAQADERPVVGISVAEPDAGADVLAAALVRALVSLRPRRREFRLARELGVGASSVLLSLLEQAWDPFVLVIDDVHQLRSAESSTVIHAVAEHLPTGSQLVLAGRQTSQLQLARLRATHALCELDSSVLALTPDESRALLERCDLELASDAIELLTAQAEGWPAALFLATLSLRDQPDPHQAALDFTGNRFIEEYIHEEIFRGVPYPLVEFLRRTSVLESLSAPLCDAVSEQVGSAELLATAAAAHLMVSSVDDRHDWYRLHPLVRQLLEDDLRHRDPELHSAAHVRASDWYEEHGDYPLAVSHALGAGDSSRARDLIWKALPTIATGDQPTTLSHWLGSFRHEALVGESTLALAVAMSMLAIGDLAHVQWWLSVAAEGDRHEVLPGGERFDALFALANALVADDGLRAMREHAQFACRHLPTSSPFHFIARAHETWAEHLAGDRTAPAKWDALVQRSATRMPGAEAAGEAVFALAAIEGGDWPEAETRIARARSIAREHPTLDEKPSQALRFAVSALCRAHESSDPMVDWRRGRALLEGVDGAWPWVAILTRSALIRTSLLVGDVKVARELAPELSTSFDSMSGWDELRPRVESVCALVDRVHASAAGMVTPLTAAELRVLRLLPSHLSLGQIAGELFVTRNTIKSQVLAVYRKLEVSSRDEAVARARDLYLVEDPAR